MWRLSLVWIFCEEDRYCGLGDFILRYGYRTCCVVRDLSVCIMFLILYGRTGGDYEELICMCLDE